MSLADIFKELEDAKVEKDFTIADGTYDGIIEKLEFKTNAKGTQWFSFTVNLITENKKYFANLFMTEKTAKWNLTKFRDIIKNLTAETLVAEDFINEVELANKLNEKIAGTEVTLILKTNKNGFQNFNFETDEMPF
ncbi:hypothetical protein [Fusobacterium nucleatum]|uniref:hypothetical protein n=1 Tax=Fusobacterium nucleatum TaxID=851 RepID=UPI00201A4C3D|nr:hypothetical protein [Fusobacterium nucleatum]MCL4584195.1 hypothetical protein [Fusobacterium nucleatum YWH7055]